MACNCDYVLGNLGTPSCVSVSAVTKKLIFVPYKSASGVRNGIDVSDVIDEAYITAKINASDPTERWYPSPLIENVEDTKADSLFETLNSGANIFIQEGVRSFTGVYIKQSSEFLKELKKARCSTFGVYLVDLDGNLIGSISNNGETLYPILIDSETFDSVLMKATDTTVQKVMVKFEYSRIEKDENLKMIPVSDMSVDMLGVEGLLEAYITTSNILVNSVRATVKTAYGSFLNPIMVEGLTSGDFVLYNVTDSVSVTVSTSSEISDGVYALGFASQTSGDVMRLSISKNGFVSEPVTFTI